MNIHFYIPRIFLRIHLQIVTFIQLIRVQLLNQALILANSATRIGFLSPDTEQLLFKSARMKLKSLFMISEFIYLNSLT